MRNIMLWALLAAGLLLLLPPMVQGDEEDMTSGVVTALARVGEMGPMSVVEESEVRDNYYAVVGLWNNTSSRITYSFRWGNRDWKSYTINPGERRWHAWNFAVRNQASWPTPYVRFDMDRRTGSASLVTRRLTANPTWAKGYWYGDRYAFMVEDNPTYIGLRRVYDDPVGIR